MNDPRTETSYLETLWLQPCSHGWMERLVPGPHTAREILVFVDLVSVVLREVKFGSGGYSGESVGRYTLVVSCADPT
jgi:hypothetical protein